jgi:phosphoribosylformylglycinamidine synthase
MGLKDAEYERIVDILGRHPNLAELGMFAVLWSEHCGYKHSKLALRRLPTDGWRVVQGPGENAGIVDIGGGWVVCWKAESHNHPSAIEPFQGAATGVGGIVRDILAMGARPVAVLDSLRFGDPAEPRVRYLISGVVGGIAAYGNCIGVPTVGGELACDDSYRDNCLVNVMCVGVARRDRLARGVAAGPGNPVLLAGNRTGRDGIHGCTFASEELGERSQERRPAVQVGDPFIEKLLIEACLEALGTGAVVGLNDLGAAGLTSACAETAARAGTGMDIDLDRVKRREPGMSPYEVMISESQERMLLIVERGREAEVTAVFDRWGLEWAEIGRVTDDGVLRVREGGSLAAEVPVAALTRDVPVYDPVVEEPPYLRRAWRAPLPGDFAQGELPGAANRALTAILASPEGCAKDWIFSQYDHMVQVNTVVTPGADAAVLRVKELGPAGLAVTTDGNGRLCYLDPRRGAALAVAEAARNVSCLGAEPLGITNCLNFGNPEKPHVSWQFAAAVDGMAAACRALDVPVTGGNVSFYNETEGAAGRRVHPTPVIGLVGLVADVTRCPKAGFQAPGDVVGLIGPDGAGGGAGDGAGDGDGLGGSLYLYAAHGLVAGRPAAVDFDLERRVQDATRELARSGILASCHDCSEGGLLAAIAECCLLAAPGAGGAEVEVPAGGRVDGALYGELPSRVVVSAAAGDWPRVEAACAARGVPVRRLGRVAPGRIVARRAGGTQALVDVATGELRAAWAGALESLMGGARQ